MVVPDGHQKVGEAEGGRSVLTPRVREGSVNESEEGPIDQGICIDEEESRSLLRRNDNHQALISVGWGVLDGEVLLEGHPEETTA
jgi:hypothetical protein